ncbi:hypothetical protein L6164_009357 [Bauhinia variegata]|uniref:Uncharacterized protein n=1 Tax=Bauhinia variegata TaxID=167791 RepID=A0ACB9PJE8_BAUVA|nr:hypothetical protein L6164_009357 [Bauhinia variegata]
MSPAAVDLRSLIHSPSSSVQNSNSMPDSTSHSSFNCTSFSYSNLTESGESLNSSKLDHALGRGFAAEFPPPPVSATGSAASGRSRPRMVKLRKHSVSQHARSRSRTGLTEVSSGFNPFRPGSETSNQVSSCTSTSNAPMESSSGVENDFKAYNDSSSNSHMKFGNVDFVFGVKRSESATVLNSEQGAAAAMTEELGPNNRMKVTVDKEAELGNGDHVEFVFSAKRSDIKSNSCQERRKTSQNGTKTVSGGEGMELESEPEHLKVDGSGFVLYGDQNDSVSNPNAEKRESSKCEETSGFDDGQGIKFNTEVEFGKHDSFGSILGDNQGGKTSNFKVEKQESLDSVRNCDPSVDTSSTKMESISNSNRPGDQDDHLSYDDKLKSGYGSSNNISSSYSTTPAFKFTGEMEKLNINDSEKVGGADMTRDLKNLSVNNGSAFVFGSNEKAFGSSSASSVTNSDGQASFPDASFEDIGGQYIKPCLRNNVQNGCGCDVAGNYTGIPCFESSTSKEPECQEPEDSPVKGAKASFGLGSQSSNNVSKAHSMSKDQDQSDDVFTTIPEGSGESFTDFKPPTWDPSCFKENLFPKLDKKLDSTQKSRFSKEKGSKQMRRKLKLHSLNKKQTGEDHLPTKSTSQDTQDPPGCYSPMDFSPYQDTKADDQYSEASAELNNPSIPDNGDVHSSLHSTNPAGYGDEYSDSVERGADINGNSSISDSHSYGAEIYWPTLKSAEFLHSSVAGASGYAEVGCNSNTERQTSDQPCFGQGLGNPKDIQFSFSASPSGEITSSFKRKQRKKNRRKVGCNSFIFSPDLNGMAGSSVLSPSSHSSVLDKSQINDQFKKGNVASLATIQETCDKWRLRGNEAYKDGDLSKAEDFYTSGINSIPSNERSGCRIKPLLLCYSNRAATRMALGRIREAIGDCLMATDVDPTFLKVQMRTANCHLLLGEVENAQQCFNKCLESGNVVCLDRRVTVEAAEGLQKAQKVAECINRSAELLKGRTAVAAGAVLELLSEALPISLYSEKLLQMKAEALCLLRKYDSAIQLCEQSQYLAEKNFASQNSVENPSISTCDSFMCVRLWRWSVISRCYFHLGRLDASLNVIEKLQQDVSINKCVVDRIDDSLSLAATIRELLYQKNAGNEAFKAGKYTEAIEHYTVALSGNIKSCPFAAICFCNRAAAYQALGQITDAISDSSVAIALDGNYVKAISRRATLHEMVRDYGQAACDLRRVISILENQSNEKAKQSRKLSGSNGDVKELREFHQHLLSVEEQAKKGIPLDLYRILGIKESDTATDIKKAYHKAALRHHPDKAGQSIARSEIGDEGQVWKEILQEVHKDADRLFKMIGEAYAVLSDPAKRSEYDLEEEIRKATKQSNRGSTCRRSSDVYGYGRPSDIYRSPFERSSNRRHGRDNWKPHGNSYSRCTNKWFSTSSIGVSSQN